MNLLKTITIFALCVFGLTAHAAGQERFNKKTAGGIWSLTALQAGQDYVPQIRCKCQDRSVA